MVSEDHVSSKISRRIFLKKLGALTFGFLIGETILHSGLYSNKRRHVLPNASATTLMPSGPSYNAVSPRMPYNYIIYNRGTTNKPLYSVQRSSDNKELNENGFSFPEDAIQLALNQIFMDQPTLQTGPGHIYVCSSQYRLSNNFQGFKLQSNTRLTLDPTAQIIVPNGYNGVVFDMHSNNSQPVNDCIIDGGHIREDNSGTDPKRLWVAIRLWDSAEGPNAKGVYFNKIVNTSISDAGIGLNLRVDGTHGFVNGNVFQFIKMWTNNIFVDFDMSSLIESSYVLGSETFGIHRNSFENIECQSGANTSNGILNIRNVGNTFSNVNVWDIHAGGPQASSGNIHKHASNTIVIGGSMTTQNFVDEGRQTFILDQWQGLKYLKRN